MSNPDMSRFCPICDQIVSRSTTGVLVVIGRREKKLLHEDCAKMVSESLATQANIVKETE